MEADAEGVYAPDAIDWSRVRAATYRIEQRFRYEYPGPIRDLRQRLVLAPPRAHGAQRRLGHRIVASLPGRQHAKTDGFGNIVAQFVVPHVEHSVDFTFQALVRREGGGEHTVDASVLRDPRLTQPRWPPPPTCGPSTPTPPTWPTRSAGSCTDGSPIRRASPTSSPPPRPPTRWAAAFARTTPT